MKPNGGEDLKDFMRDYRKVQMGVPFIRIEEWGGGDEERSFRFGGFLERKGLEDNMKTRK